MTFILIVLAIAALVIGYFCLGILLKFMWAWWPAVFGVPVLLAVGFAFGWIGALIAIGGLFGLLSASNNWHGTSLYLEVERRIDGLFYLSDT